MCVLDAVTAYPAGVFAEVMTGVISVYSSEDGEPAVKAPVPLLP